MQKRPCKTLMSKIMACLPNTKVDGEGVTTAECEKSGRFPRAEFSREKGPSRSPKNEKCPVCGMVASLTYPHIRKALRRS